MGNSLRAFRGLEPEPAAIPFAGLPIQPDGQFNLLFANSILGSQTGSSLVFTTPWNIQVQDPNYATTIMQVDYSNWEFYSANGIAPNRFGQSIIIFDSFDPSGANARQLSIAATNYGASIQYLTQGTGAAQNEQFTINCGYPNRVWVGGSSGTQQAFWTFAGGGVTDQNPGGPGHLIPYSSGAGFGANTQDIGSNSWPVRNCYIGTALQFGVSGANQSGLRSGTGVPAAGLGANGDFYFRLDGAVGAALYQKRAGAWVAATGV